MMATNNKYTAEVIAFDSTTVPAETLLTWQQCQEQAKPLLDDCELNQEEYNRLAFVLTFHMNDANKTTIKIGPVTATELAKCQTEMLRKGLEQAFQQCGIELPPTNDTDVFVESKK